MDRRAFLAVVAGAGVARALPKPALAFSSPPAPAPGSLDLGGLEARHGGRLGVCAMGPAWVGWRADERFAYASTFKLFLAACVLDRVQEGRERLDRAIPIRERDLVPHAPVTGPAVGSSLTVEALCKATVEVSDNPAANILLRELGGLQTFQAWYRGIGDEVTRVDRYETQLNSALPGDPRDTTTPAQAVANLDRVLLRGLLAPELLARLRTWLVKTPTGPNRIKAGVPDGWRVAHKTGTGARNSYNNIGVTFPPSGAPVVIAVYYTGAEASPEALDAVVAEATRAALVALRRA